MKKVGAIIFILGLLGSYHFYFKDKWFGENDNPKIEHVKSKNNSPKENGASIDNVDDIINEKVSQFNKCVDNIKESSTTKYELQNKFNSCASQNLSDFNSLIYKLEKQGYAQAELVNITLKWDEKVNKITDEFQNYISHLN